MMLINSEDAGHNLDIFEKWQNFTFTGSRSPEMEKYFMCPGLMSCLHGTFLKLCRLDIK